MFFFCNYAHNPGPSLYPFLISLYLFSLSLSLVCWFGGGGFLFVFFSFLFFLFGLGFWGKDVFLEGALGFHSSYVRYGFFFAFFLFIFRE